MFSLILATLCSASIALIFKNAALKSYDQKAITVSNYLTASVVSLLMILISDLQIYDFKSVDFKNTLIIGIATGVFFLLSFTCYQLSVRRNGASVSGMFAKLGILIPMLISVFYWNEIPTWIQSVGICIAIIAIAIANMNFGKKQVLNIHKSVSMLVALFVVGGLAEFFNKIFQKTTAIHYKPLFLFFVFFTAFILSVIVYLNRKDSVSNLMLSFLTGIIVGIPNLFSSFFLLDALNALPAAIVFPAYSAGSIFMITVFSVLIFKEKLVIKDWTAIGLTTVSLVLLNM